MEGCQSLLVWIVLAYRIHFPKTFAGFCHCHKASTVFENRHDGRQNNGWIVSEWGKPTGFVLLVRQENGRLGGLGGLGELGELDGMMLRLSATLPALRTSGYGPKGNVQPARPLGLVSETLRWNCPAGIREGDRAWCPGFLVPVVPIRHGHPRVYGPHVGHNDVGGAVPPGHRPPGQDYLAAQLALAPLKYGRPDD